MIELNILATESTADIADAMNHLDGFSFKLHADLDSLLGSLAQNADTVVLVEASESIDLVAGLARIGQAYPDVPGIIMGDNLPISAVRALLVLRCWDILELPTSIEALRKAIMRVRAMPGLTEPAATTPNKQGKCWAFMSPIGGGGATLLATETAYQLSQSQGHPRTCLIDMNFFDGRCADYLNCEPNLTLAELDTSPDRIDTVLLRAFTTSHRSGLDLIAAPRTPDPSLFPSREAMLRCLEVACDNYDYVIVDIPRWPMAWTSDIVNGADETMLISELSVPALNAARDWILDFDSEAMPGSSRIKVILNRKQKTMFGGNVTIEQAEKAIQQPVFSAVHSDWATALASVNLGQPVSITKPNSLISKDVASMIDKLVDPAKAERSARKTTKVA